MPAEKPMAFKASYEIKCSCGEKFMEELYEYVFAEYDPDLKEALLTGEFNWLTCPLCGERFHVETRFLYRDEKNMLWIWVCRRDEESQREELYEELMEKSTHFEDHHLDDKENYRKFLVFGREALIKLLLTEDKDLKRIEGKQLREKKALRLIMEESGEPGLFLLQGDKVKIAMPLRIPDEQSKLLDGPEMRKRYLKFYSQGLNIHNPYSSFLGSRLRTKWNKIREKDKGCALDNEFDDFATSWAAYKMDPKGFKASCPEKNLFFEDIRKLNVSRKLHSINPKQLLNTDG
jgi:hypothetical protein